jgi:hypothetical protein
MPAISLGNLGMKGAASRHEDSPLSGTSLDNGVQEELNECPKGDWTMRSRMVVRLYVMVLNQDLSQFDFAFRRCKPKSLHPSWHTTPVLRLVMGQAGFAH